MLDIRPVDLDLFPDCADVSPAGRLTLGGLDVDDLRNQFGSPVFVYDLDEIKRNFAEAFDEFGSGVAYATKAFLSGHVVETARQTGLSLDVSTDGEYELVRSANFPAEKVVVHGNNKSDWLIARAIDDDVQWIVLDNLSDIERTEAAAAERGRVVRVVVRVNPGIEVHTHEYSQTGNRGSKFGVAIWNDEAKLAIDMIREAPHLEFVGVHSHIGSLVYSLENFELGLEALRPVIEYSNPSVVVAGGGLGVRYTNADSAPTFANWSKAVRVALRRTGFEGTVLVEPGRSLVAKAALTMYSVGVVREIEGTTTVAVDGGMSDNPRPLLYNSGYEAALVDGIEEPRPHEIRLVGSHCESGDTIISSGSVQRCPTRGELLVTPVTGAYGYSMASNYNRMRRPAVVFISGGQAMVGIQRESFADLRRNDAFFAH